MRVIHPADGLLRYRRPIVARHYQRIRVHKAETETRVEPESSRVLKPARVFTGNLCNY